MICKRSQNSYSIERSKKIKNCFLAILLLLITFGCAGPQINIVDNMGKPMPAKYYTSSTTSENPINITFYYVGEVRIKDVDYSYQYIPVYIDKRIKHIKRGDFNRLSIVLHIYNPSNAVYGVKFYKSVVKENLDIEHTKGEVAVSVLKYRKYKFQLPLEWGIKYVSCNVRLIDEYSKKSYMQTGVFGYHLE